MPFSRLTDVELLFLICKNYFYWDLVISLTITCVKLHAVTKTCTGIYLKMLPVQSFRPPVYSAHTYSEDSASRLHCMEEKSHQTHNLCWCTEPKHQWTLEYTMKTDYSPYSTFKKQMFLPQLQSPTPSKISSTTYDPTHINFPIQVNADSLLVKKINLLFLPYIII